MGRQPIAGWHKVKAHTEKKSNPVTDTEIDEWLNAEADGRAKSSIDMHELMDLTEEDYKAAAERAHAMLVEMGET